MQSLMHGNTVAIRFSDCVAAFKLLASLGISASRKFGKFEFTIDSSTA